MDYWKKLKSLFDRKISSKFLFTVVAATLAIFVVMFLYISREQERHIMDQVKKQAVILHKQITLTRNWASQHGPILVPEGSGLGASPFMSDSIITMQGGDRYVKVSPSMLTQLLSKMASEEGLYSFRLTGPNPLNPENLPDEAEMAAFEHFSKSTDAEVFRQDTIGGRHLLRRIAPVRMSGDCIECHGAKGYQEGDLAGLLSVMIPMEKAADSIMEGSAMLLAGGVVLATALIGLVYLSARFIVFQRLLDIKNSMQKLIMTHTPIRSTSDDEIEEIAQLCRALDTQIMNRRDDLERRIVEATKDLHRTNIELARVNEELTLLDRTKKEFFSDISHELRGPMSNIKGAAALLSRKLQGGEATYLEIINNNIEHLSKVVLDFLDYSKIESGRLELNLVPQPVGHVVDRAVEAMTPQAQMNLINIRKKGQMDLMAFYDFLRIYQVITNLLSNALRYSPTSSQIIISMEARDNQALISVIDRGPGIDPAHQEFIFKKFYQAPPPVGQTTQKGSSGIGLAICKGIVEAHQGMIWVESEPGKGAAFRFTLPLGAFDDE
jgi:signal transduction histidine kinase